MLVGVIPASFSAFVRLDQAIRNWETGRPAKAAVADDRPAANEDPVAYSDRETPPWPEHVPLRVCEKL